jgi:hypothetical protein
MWIIPEQKKKIKAAENGTINDVLPTAISLSIPVDGLLSDCPLPGKGTGKIENALSENR